MEFTDYHAKYFAHELTKRQVPEPCAEDSDAFKAGYKTIADGGLLICLADAVTKGLINAVAEAEPMQFICLDKAFGGNDQFKANAVQTVNARNMGKEKHNQIIFRTV